jgi:hypothetical protein
MTNYSCYDKSTWYTTNDHNVFLSVWERLAAHLLEKKKLENCESCLLRDISLELDMSGTSRFWYRHHFVHLYL